MIDTHCHLNDAKYTDTRAVIADCTRDGVTAFVCVGYDARANADAVALAHQYECVYCAVGYHPDNAGDYDPATLERYLDDDRVVALGEIGLDYYWHDDNKDIQKSVFADQIEMAKRHHLPIVVHCRDAYGDCLDVLRAHAPYPDGGILHCFSGSDQWAREIVNLGLKISFSGTICFKNAKNLTKVAQNIDISDILMETDSPYLSPIRGTTNYPKNVRMVAEKIAEIKSLDIDDVVATLDDNARKVYKKISR